MSGTIHGSAAWGRHVVAAIRPDERAAIEDAIPDGHFLAVGCRTSPTDISVRLMKGEPGHGTAVQVAVIQGNRTAAYGCRSVLQLYALRETA